MDWINGLLGFSWWQVLLAALVLTHITIVSVTVYLHRHSAHRSLDLHPALSHFFRFWLWMTTGMNTREWTAIHRKHHARCDTEEDPHSPVVLGLKEVLLRGTELYQAESRNQETLDKFGQGTPDDFMERHFYTGRPNLGISLIQENAVEVITGVNLPMLIKVATLGEDKPLEELATFIKSYGQRNISVASEILPEDGS